MLATRIHACAEAIDFSQSLASRRHRLSQAKVLSTTHRLGRSSKPWAVSERLMISSFQRPSPRVSVPRRRRRRRSGEAMTATSGAPSRSIGCVHDQADQQAECIGDDVTLAALDLLARVIAPNTTAFRGFHALAVDHPGARAGLASFQLPGRHDQVMVDALQQAVGAPVVEIALDRGRRREVVRQHRPLAAVEAMYMTAPPGPSSSAGRSSCAHERRDQRPRSGCDHRQPA